MHAFCIVLWYVSVVLTDMCLLTCALVCALVGEMVDQGSFAFLDELMVGQVPGVPHGVGDIGLTHDEARTHFAIWCMMTSPMWLTVRRY